MRLPVVAGDAVERVYDVSNSLGLWCRYAVQCLRQQLDKNIGVPFRDFVSHFRGFHRHPKISLNTFDFF